MTESYFKFSRLVHVEALDDYKLRVAFLDGKTGVFDVKPYLSDRYFAPLKNKALFSAASVGALTVEWPSGIDIAPEEIYHGTT